MTDYYKTRRLLLMLAVFYTYIDHHQITAVFSTSACHGTQNADCDYFSMSCTEQDHRIHITEMLYGHKNYSCSTKANRCLKENRNGCCVYKDVDCFDVYSPLHAYNLHRECSMQQDCGPLPAPNNRLPACQNELSTYVYLSYECVPYNETLKIDFCEDRVILPFESRASIVFSAETNRHTGSTCSCTITTMLNDIRLTYADIRMFKHKGGTGSTCSSAQLTSSNPDGISTECTSTAEEEDNFLYQYATDNGEQVRLTLTDLNKRGQDDVPYLIWILVDNAFRIECSTSHAATPVTVAATSSDRTSNIPGQNAEALDDDDDGGNAAAIAGAVVGVLVVIVIIVIVVIVVIRKRRLNKGPKKRESCANVYTDHNIYEDIDETNPNNIYDPVYEPQKAAPIYDPVYEPGAKQGATQSTSHVEKVPIPKRSDKGKEGLTQRLKTPFTKMVSYIKVRTGREPQRNTSYDHLHVAGVTTDNSSDEDQKHPYSHTTDDKKPVAGKARPNISHPIDFNKQARPNSSSSKPSINNTPSDAELQAVDVGDSYIEFKTGVDENDPNIVKHNLRPTPPSRDPPSPSSARAPSPLPKPARSPSPMLVNEYKQEPVDIGTKDKAKSFKYDYADSNRLNSDHDNKDSPRVVAPKIDVDDSHIEYDYALSDGENESNTQPIYEDVERQMREASMKKHKSETDLSNEPRGYEIPVTSRQISDPNSSSSMSNLKEEPKSTNESRTPLKPPSDVSGNQKVLDLKSELQKRLQKSKPVVVDKKEKDTGDTKHSSDNGVVKSDNTETKDYEKASNIKSVLQMKRAFENK